MNKVTTKIVNKGVNNSNVKNVTLLLLSISIELLNKIELTSKNQCPPYCIIVTSLFFCLPSVSASLVFSS